jgi:hypothetical protein
MSCKNSKKKPRSQTAMLLQRSWETLNRKASLFPTYAREGLEFLTAIAIVGGYGLIQWTSLGRYNNLGKFAKKYGYDPSTLEGQTAYMINESVFQRYLPMFEGGGQTVRQYMVGAYYWLGWGIKGNRELYAYDYTKKLVWS